MLMILIQDATTWKIILISFWVQRRRAFKNTCCLYINLQGWWWLQG
jgi:hypothetical protein